MTITSLIPDLILLLVCHSSGFATDIQDQIKRINAAKLPVESASANDFVPKGWIIEEEVTGDLNSDSIPDVAVKLVEEKSPDFDEGNPQERQRALLILFKLPNGRLQRVAIADKVLQCTRCGGAFFRGDKTPAHIQNSKGVVITKHEHVARHKKTRTN